MINFLHTFQPNSIAFTISSLAIHWYGLFLLIGIVLGYWLVGKLAHRQELSKEVVTSLYVNVLIGGLIGARVYHVLTDWQFYGNNLNQILAVWNGGLAIHGGILGAVVVVIYYVKKHNVNFWKVADLFAPAAILGQAIGRWGNYFNQELFGRPTDSSWGIPISPLNRPAGFEQFEYFHPTFLYESLINLAIFGILLFIFKKQRTTSASAEASADRPSLFPKSAGVRSGMIFWLYIGLYSAGRMMVESIRINPTAYVFGIALPLLVSAILAATALVMILKTLSFKRKPE